MIAAGSFTCGDADVKTPALVSCGVGAKKLEAYGPAILRVLEEQRGLRV